MIRIAPAVLATAAIVAVVPAASQAATPVTKPSVTTGLAGSITPESATLTGAVDPGGAPTNYRFEFGTTTKYGLKTARASAGFGVSPVAATGGLGGLKSATTYHYRIVASNRKGTVRGKDRTFRTPRQPLGFAVAANPSAVPFGGTTTIAGTLGGTGSAGRQVRLEQNPWPYTAGFQPVGNVLLTTATGGFSFPVLGLGINTQYRVSTTDRTPTVSDVVGTQVGVVVTTNVKRRVKKGNTLRFSGRVRPAKVGEQVGVQRLSGTKWKTLKGSRTRTGTADYASYATRVRIRRSGTYRVFVTVGDGSLQGLPGSSVRIALRR
ncbi:unannotated protein [freshwater metagenome]|uniref:Unannotated protein n=1 Tax=freshwater metagenome TaxID=449393 RepID=A0A6J7H3T9_9ZZZZ|nr:hypothetical protein [Actinomycetota bacterium]